MKTDSADQLTGGRWGCQNGIRTWRPYALDHVHDVTASLDHATRADLPALLHLRRRLDDAIDTLQPDPSDRALLLAARHYGTTPEHVLGRLRDPTVVRARHTYLWLLRAAGHPYTTIGARAGVDHTTAIYAVKRVDGDPSMRSVAEELLAAIRSHLRAAG